MTDTTHRTGTVPSGDVEIFYRHFGKPGGAPVFITHGANYYDSYDWIEVAAALAVDREVVAYDTRGFGASGRSVSKNYSHDAQMGDINALMDHLGWDKVVAMGHSMGGGRVILFGSRFAARTAGVVIVDHCPGRGGTDPTVATPSVGNPQTVYPSIEAAHKTMSRHTDAPAGSPARARLEAFLKPAEGGVVFPRDPDFANLVPVIDGWSPEIAVGDMWVELSAIAAPTLIVRGTLSNRYNDEALARVRGEFPHIEMIDVEAGHDVAGAAPGPLIDGVRRFLTERIDGQAAAAQ